MLRVQIITLIFWSGITLSKTAWGQFASISGKVVDAKTHVPVPFASVALENTLLAMIAGEDGSFHINHIPKGRYVMAVSSVGYKTWESAISFSGQASEMTINLEPIVKILQEVTVKSRPRDFKKMYRIFKKYFIGESRNAKECTIKNDNVINMDVDENTGAIKADSSEPIAIENLALGYEVFYLLDEFIYDEKHQSVLFKGHYWFSEMTPASASQARKWARARDHAYYGSLNHFFRSLKLRCLDEDGFKIFAIRNNKPVPIDESYFFTAKPDSIIRANDKIEIVYSKAYEEINFTGRPSVNIPQTSYLSLDSHGLVIYDNGYYEDPMTVLMQGYLGWREKLAMFVPLEYEPHLNHKP
jgi:CarboxypepD_reg-like domain